VSTALVREPQQLKAKGNYLLITCINKQMQTSIIENPNHFSCEAQYCIRFAGFLARMACSLLGPCPYRTDSLIFTSALSELTYYHLGSTCMERMTTTLQHFKKT
jgi:hypothetical protein